MTTYKKNHPIRVHKSVAPTFIALLLRITALLAFTFPVDIYAGARTVNEVRGHGVLFDLIDGDSIDSISINAWLDESGAAHGFVSWGGEYFASEDTRELGWVWHIEVTDLYVIGNVAYVGGIVVHDNKFPESEGTYVSITVIDNGSGAAAKPDEVLFSPIDGGNFTVR